MNFKGVKKYATFAHNPALSKRGYTVDAIDGERARLVAVTAAIATLRTAEDAKKNAVRQRNLAVKAADRWWAEFSAVADVVTQDQPSPLGAANSAYNCSDQLMI